MFKRPPRVFVYQPLWCLMNSSPTSSSSSGMKTPKTTEEDPDDPQSADEGGIQMEDTSH